MKTNLFNKITMLGIAGILTLGMANVCFAVTLKYDDSVNREELTKTVQQIEKDPTLSDAKKDKAELDATNKYNAARDEGIARVNKANLNSPKGASHPPSSTALTLSTEKATASSTGKSTASRTGKSTSPSNGKSTITKAGKTGRTGRTGKK